MNDTKITPFPGVPMRYVRLPVFCQLTGYTEKAVRLKIDRGHWLESRHYRKAPDGHIMMDLEAYNQWVEGSLAA
jgi:hypothetical protein